MSTPQSTTSNEAASGTSKKLEQITFRFCSECSNMLYPKEDSDAHKLQFTCRTCQYTEEAQSSCVFRNVLNNSAGETAGVTQDVGSDPTVSDSPMLCIGCGCALRCSDCHSPSGDLFVSTKEKRRDSMGMCQFNINMPWGDEDPFAEYDEEPMDEDEPNLLSDDASDSILSTSGGPSTPMVEQGFSNDGAMIVDI